MGFREKKNFVVVKKVAGVSQNQRRPIKNISKQKKNVEKTRLDKIWQHLQG
jgi:hypothetical protein